MKRYSTAILYVGILVISLALVLAVFQMPIALSMTRLAEGAFGDKYGVSRTLVKATPLLLVALGMTIAWRAGMFNIGGEGQFLVGGLAAAALFQRVHDLPSWLLVPSMTIAAALGGAGYAMFAGWLAVRRGVNVVISTILLNFVAIQLLGWLTSGPLRENSQRIPQTEVLTSNARYFQWDRQIDLHAGAVLAPIAAIALWFWVYRTYPGLRLRVVGESPTAARSAKIDPKRIQLLAMAVSGALCGLAAATDYMGVTGSIDKGFSQQWGFLGIPVALVGGLHPLGCVGSAVYFGALLAGSESLSRFASSGPTFVYVVQGIAVLALVSVQSWRRKQEAASLA